MTVNSDDFVLPVIKATEGPDGLLISGIRNEGWVTLDPGFLTTAQCESKITYIDGDNSILRYRGYPIEQLAEKSTFLETAYLLIFGQLPSAQEFESFKDQVLTKTIVGEDFRAFLSATPKSTHPMTMLASAVNALEAFSPMITDPEDDEQVNEAAMAIMAKTRTVVSYLLRRHRNEPLLYPNGQHGYIDDFLRMCFARPYEAYQMNPLMVTALDKMLILQADHEQNCSTSVVRIVGSANASLFASIAAGINALSGPLHGGANEAAYQQFLDIEKALEAGTSVKEYVMAKKERGQKIFGLGHRVYKSYDPRAAIAKEYALKIKKLDNVNANLIKIALELESVVLADPYFAERKLFPNVDFWTTLVYDALGFEPEMFTALFALARIPGWIAHWREMHHDPLHKIGRPRQVYSGEGLRDYVKIGKR